VDLRTRARQTPFSRRPRQGSPNPPVDRERTARSEKPQFFCGSRLPAKRSPCNRFRPVSLDTAESTHFRSPCRIASLGQPLGTAWRQLCRNPPAVAFELFVRFIEPACSSRSDMEAPALFLASCRRSGCRLDGAGSLGGEQRLIRGETVEA